MKSSLKIYVVESPKREEVFEHPLKPSIITIQESKIKRRFGGSNANSNSSSVSGTPKKGPLSNFHPLSSALDGIDPLSQFAASLDPLSQMAEEHERAKELSASRKCHLDDSFEPWSSKKVAILSKYTTSEKLSIATSFLSGGEKVIGKPTTTVSDKVKTRLEQLDDFEEGSVKEMMNLSQQEYVNRIEELNQALRESWEQDQRVKALKIGIQSAKLLVDTAVIQFYPSKFVLITDILDNFGNLVYQRIHSKAEHQKPGSKHSVPLPEQFTPDQVPESAKETCRNWFFKIASIRELIPRFYMETAILKSYSFLTQGEYSKALMRLTKMIRGIGDPLAAAYARCYLCRVGMSVAPEAHEHLRNNFWDFLMMYHQLQSKFVQDTLTKQNLDLPAYLTLYPPALDWILQCVTYKASETVLSQVLHNSKNQCNSALLLNSVMAAFKPEFIAKRATELVEIMKECDDSGFPKHLLFRTLGLCLISADPPENEKLQLLNDIWKIVTKLKNPADYMSCAEVWIEYIVKHFSKREVNTFLGDIIRHMLLDRAFEQHYPQLTKVVDRILLHIHDFSVIFSMDKFLPFLDMLQKDSVKVDVCKNILEAFMRYQQETTCDPVIVNAAMFICKTIHDSVNALTLEDERRQIGVLICAFIRKISFGRDFEQQLGFYVEARATFSNLDMALIQLVQCVNLLAMRTRQIVKGHHTRKTSAFVKACIAYCFITIPSLTDVLSRLELYLLSAQVALLNQSLSQADAFLKSAISLIPDTPASIEIDNKHKSTEPFLISYICNLLSTLLIVPDHPEQEPLYLIRGLMNVIQDYSWESDSKVTIYLNFLNLLSALSQESYIWSIDGVDSNDALYGSDPKFLAEINKISSTLIDEMLSHLKQLGDKGNFKRQSHLALELMCHVVANGDLSCNSLFTLCNNLWLLAHRHGYCDTKFAENCLAYVKMRGSNLGNAYQSLASKLQVPTQV
ncbi:VPS35 endosomal protein-sorting factor-like isoform X2 [Parasteatoda tepidariorum]|uniref:VPS35 endosomal protein-sorting factor-like isoform X2 n=1 Tax=Parasteatoda tepidariorum TaxID=114398 RepID=UPI001C725C54|nr:VPS35 endosomal protein-sorting factor-like isoform X2 [Parasteatoda tepidariorum]